MAQDPEKASHDESNTHVVRPPPSSSSSSSFPSSTSTLTGTSASINGPHLEPIRTVASHCLTSNVETDAERMAREPVAYIRTDSSIGSIASRQPEFEVDFSDNDPENPLNWALWYRCWVIFCVSFATWAATLYSTSYTSSMSGLMAEFGASKTLVTLGMTTYLLGLAAGSLVVAPLSELYGRQKVYIVCLLLWAVLIVPCGLAKSLTTIIVVRFIGLV